MRYYPETESHIRVEVKVVLYFSNYAIKKQLDHATGVQLLKIFYCFESFTKLTN